MISIIPKGSGIGLGKLADKPSKENFADEALAIGPNEAVERQILMSKTSPADYLKSYSIFKRDKHVAMKNDVVDVYDKFDSTKITSISDDGSLDSNTAIGSFFTEKEKREFSVQSAKQMEIIWNELEKRIYPQEALGAANKLMSDLKSVSQVYKI